MFVCVLFNKINLGIFSPFLILSRKFYRKYLKETRSPERKHGSLETKKIRKKICGQNKSAKYVRKNINRKKLEKSFQERLESIRSLNSILTY